MKFFDLFRRFSRRTIKGASLPEVIRSRPGWFTVLPLAASFLLWAAPLRAEFAFLANNFGITTYTIGSNGAPSQVGSLLSTGYIPISEAMDPKGRFVFFVNKYAQFAGNRVWV